MTFNLDILRGQVRDSPASPKIRALRLHLFDLYRYGEDYENIFTLLSDIGVIDNDCI